MKKTTKISMIAALSLSALTPAIGFAAENDTTHAKAGFYNIDSKNVVTLESFIFMTTAQKAAILMNDSYYFANGEGAVVKAKNILDAKTDAALTALEMTEAKFTETTGFVLTPEGTVEVAPGEVVGLTVESVMAINTTGVTVAINKLTEDLDAQTIEVKDSKGNVVEVKSLNLVINETEATFVFKTELAADPTGVWTIAGISFDTDVAAKLTAINAGNTEIKLYNALTASGVNNVEVANSPAYFSADKPADGFKTIAEVQTFIDEVNAKQLTGTEQTEKVEALVKLLDETGGKVPSEVQVLNALEGSWDRVNADSIAAYITAMKSSAGGTKVTNATTFKAVQTQLDALNVTAVTSLVNAAKADAKRVSYTKAVAAMKFVREDDTKVATDKVKANLQKDLDLLNLVLNVKEASTAAQLANAYNALVAKVDNKTTIGTEAFSTELRTKYMDATKVITGSETVVTAADIEAAILKVNTQKRAELFNDVANVIDTAGATQTSTADVLKKLTALAAYSDKAVFDIESVVTTESRLASYRTLLAALTAVDETAYTGAAAPGAVTTLITSVQTQITNANATAVTGPLTKLEEAKATGTGELFWNETTSAAITLPAEKAAALLAELKNPELKLGNVVDANAAVYLAEIAAIQTAATVAAGDTAAAIKALKVAVSDINLLVDINNATTASEVHTALLALSGNADYINVPSADRLWVAGKVLDARNAVVSTKKFASVAALKAEIVVGTPTVSTGLHKAALAAVNGLVITKTTTDVINALILVDADFAKKTPAEQGTIAEDFFLGLKFAEVGGALTPQFRTLADIKTAAGL